MNQPVFAAIDALEFPELHDESIPAMAFLQALNRLMLASGIKDFSLRDLHKPDPQRLRRNLSAIINFAKFREEKLIAYTELQEQFDALLHHKESLEAQQEALQAELAALKESRKQEIPEVARIDTEIQSLYAENQALNTQQASLSSEVRTLKQQANAFTDEASQLRYKLSQARSINEDLKSQIVQSPQRIQALLEEISMAVERERAAFAEAEKRSRDLYTRLETAGKIEKEVAKVVSLMGETESEVSKKKEVSRKVKALRADVAAIEHEAAQLTTTHEHFKRQQAALVDRIERVKMQCEVKKQAAEGRVEEQLRHKEAIEAENAAAVAKLAENESIIRAYRERIAEVRSTHEAQIAAVLSQYQTLIKSVQQYHEDMERSMVYDDQTSYGAQNNATQTITMGLESVTRKLQGLTHHQYNSSGNVTNTITLHSMHSVLGSGNTSTNTAGAATNPGNSHALSLQSIGKGTGAVHDSHTGPVTGPLLLDDATDMSISAHRPL